MFQIKLISDYKFQIFLKGILVKTGGLGSNQGGLKSIFRNILVPSKNLHIKNTP
jgi:hypothetical protein